MPDLTVKMVNDFGSDEANKLAKELTKVRDTILREFPTDGSSSFYEEWLIKCVESPYEIANLVKAYVDFHNFSMFIKPELGISYKEDKNG